MEQGLPVQQTHDGGQGGAPADVDGKAHRWCRVLVKFFDLSQNEARTAENIACGPLTWKKD